MQRDKWGDGGRKMEGSAAERETKAACDAKEKMFNMQKHLFSLFLTIIGRCGEQWINKESALHHWLHVITIETGKSWKI